MQSLRHTISFNLDLELNQKTQNEPIIFASYYNLIEGNFHSEHANSIIFEDKVQQSALICVGIIKCHIKTSIFDHFIVSMGGFRQMVLVKNENVTIGPAIPVNSRFERKMHCEKHPLYVGYNQTAGVPPEHIPDDLKQHSNNTILNLTNRYNVNRVGKVIGFLFYGQHRYFVVNYNHNTTELVAETKVCGNLPDAVIATIRSSAHYYKGKPCDIVSTHMLGTNVWHHVNCAGHKLIDYPVSSSYMFSTNMSLVLLNTLKNDDTWVIDDIINFNDYMSQYKREPK